MSWPLPPELPWPRFLRMLRDPAPPKGWLEAAADLPELRKRPALLRWVAQHPKASAHLRASLMPRLPWKALSAIAWDPAAHPQAKAMATDRLQSLWTSMTLGERKTLAPHTPKPLWPMVLRIKDEGLISAFLTHPKLTMDQLMGLLHPPVRTHVLEALAHSRWLGLEPLAFRVLELLDHGLVHEEPGIVLGYAAPWVKSLEPTARLVIAARLSHPALRRMCRAWASPSMADE
jgi:hypothetical protein